MNIKFIERKKNKIFNYLFSAKINMVFLLIFLGFIFPFQNMVFAQTLDSAKIYPLPKVISFNPDSTEYQRILEGIKDSVVFYSGVVTLAPNESVGVHNSKIYEEMIIILEGEGKFLISGNTSFDLKFGDIAFCPPFTEHNMVNTGNKNLKYIYIAVKSK
ncbi:MAG: cupin domain-containing protein [bacterium]